MAQINEHPLKKARLSRGLTMEQVGRHVGTTKASVWAWEHRKSRPDPERAIALSKLLGLSMEAIYTPDSKAAA